MFSFENSNETSGGVSLSKIPIVSGVVFVNVPFAGVPGVIIISSVGS